MRRSPASVRPLITRREAAQAGEIAIRRSLEEEGVSFVDLSDAERAAFGEATEPIRAEARERLGSALFELADEKIDPRKPFGGRSAPPALLAQEFNRT